MLKRAFLALLLASTIGGAALAEERGDRAREHWRRHHAEQHWVCDRWGSCYWVRDRY